MPIGQGILSLQRRAPHKKWLTVAKRRAFLEELAETCNVSASARAVGVHPRTVQKLKKSDPEFAQLWAEAIAEGVQRLREEMIAHQLGQLSSGHNPTTEGPAATPAPSTRPGSFDPVKAIAALKAFDGFGDGRRRSIKPASQAEVDRALMARLEALALQMIEAEKRAAGLPTATAGRDGGGEGA